MPAVLTMKWLKRLRLLRLLRRRRRNGALRRHVRSERIIRSRLKDERRRGLLVRKRGKQEQNARQVHERCIQVTKRLGTNASLFYAELVVGAMYRESRDIVLFRDFSRFPLAHRDISLIGPRAVTFARLQSVLTAVGAPLLKSSELFDVYEAGEEKSFALHLSFGREDRTLGGQEMDECFESIVKAAGEQLGMRLKA